MFLQPLMSSWDKSVNLGILVNEPGNVVCEGQILPNIHQFIRFSFLCTLSSGIYFYFPPETNSGFPLICVRMELILFIFLSVHLFGSLSVQQLLLFSTSQD